MPVTVHEKSGIFHLHNSRISYIMMVLPDGEIGQLYFGKHIHDREDFSHLLELAHRDMAPCVFGEEGTDGRVSWSSTTFSREHIRQEYPSFGTGDMRQPAYEILQENGSTLSHLQYQGYMVMDGKKPLPGLPATYVEKPEEAQTLVLKLRDPVSGAELELYYTIYEEFPVIARHAVIRNNSSSRLVLNRAMSLSLDLPDNRYDLLNLAGASLRERYPDRYPLHFGIQSIGSMRGHSSHQFNPFMALLRPDAGEEQGEVIGVSLVYSGNFLAQAEVDTMGVTRLMIGIHPQGFAWTLEPRKHSGVSLDDCSSKDGERIGKTGESIFCVQGVPEKNGESTFCVQGVPEDFFCTPEALLVYSDQGLGGMSRTFHTLFRTRLARGYWRDRERPIVINNWEATYMDFDQEKILQIAREAKKLGVEMFVLDDGWFGHRSDDTTSLGDWYPDPVKLPDGIAGLSEKIEALGMRFGLWVEPEMVSPDSDLFRAHPDWVLGSEQQNLCLGRHQLELDFSKQEVTDYLYDTLERLIGAARISYIKWDMNRSISEAWSRGNAAAWQGELLHRQILGVYRLYERLTSRFPQILFESCASGGGRFDPGMLYYAPQAWTSDDTDAAERIKIQYGTSMVYPVSCMSNHVSAVPNHQTNRKTSMFTRGATALFGTFGYELDVTRLSEEEQEQVKAQVCFVRQWRGFLQKGQLYRLKSPFEGNEAGWMILSSDRTEALVLAYRALEPVNAGYRRMQLSGLDPDQKYEIREADHQSFQWKNPETGSAICYGDELMQIGLLLSDRASGIRTSAAALEDAQARLFLIREVSR